MNHIKNCTSKLLLQTLFLNIILFTTSIGLFAQFTIQVTVLDGEATTTCKDGIFNNQSGDPMWSIVVEDEPEIVYSNKNCPSFVPYPNQNFVHFTTIVNCLSDLHDGKLFVCLRAFEHDPPNNNPCDVADNNGRKSCLEVPCKYFPLPKPGTDSIYNYVPDDPNLESSGFVKFKISVSEDAGTSTVNFSEVQAVNCFGENNGQATLNTNEILTDIQWDNGETTATATALDAGIHEVIITDEKGCKSIANIEIIQPNAALVANIELTETIACGGNQNGVLTDISTGGNANYQYRWSNGSTSDFIDNLPAGNYTLTVIDEKGCEDETSVTLAEPLPLEATINSTDITCIERENSGIITINNLIGGTSPYRFSIDNSPFMSSPEISNLPAGTYEILIQDENGCEKTFDQIIINNPPKITVDLGADMEINQGETIDLQAISDRNVTYEWSSTDSLSCLNCSSISVRPLNNTTYTLKITDLVTGCIAEDAINIRIVKSKNLFVPNVFSPNKDGVNDELNLFGSASIDRIIRFEIYARNGSLVYEAHDFTLNQRIGWDGLYNGQELSADVFIYFAEVKFIDKATRVFKGDFTLMR